MSGRFFQKINYSAANEDGNSELSALGLSRSDKVVCITGSGARTLDLLLAQPQSIHSVDFNPAQNHLLQLKIAAYRTLERNEFEQLVGLQPSKNVQSIYEKLKTNLPLSNRTFWDNNQKLFDKGVLYCGTWEKLLSCFSKATVFRRRHVDGLLNASDLESQKRYWKKHWSGPFLKNFLRIAFNRFLWTNVIREPGAKLIPKSFDVAEYMYRCIERMAHHSLLRNNPYANLLFYGRYQDQCQLPLHLRPENFDLIKSQVDSIKVVTASLDTFLKDCPNRFDAFSLSDFSSYAPPELYHSIWNGVLLSSKPGARFCERFFMVKMNDLLNRSAEERVRQPWEEKVHEDRLLAKQLAELDHTCIYSFRVGSILR